MKNLFVRLCIPLFGLLSTSTLAQTTFTGLVSDAWEEADNWDNGLPANGNDATIPAGLSVVISSSLFFDFQISNYGSFVINGNGEINNNGIFYNNGLFYNNGAIDNNGSFVIDEFLSNNGFFFNYGNGYINNNGHIDSNGYFENEGYIYNNGYINNWDFFENYGNIDNNGSIDNNSNIINFENIFNYYEIRNLNNISNFGAIFNCFGSFFGNPVVENPLEEINCGSPEVCDGLDNDLDGDIDEGCGCADDMACNFNPLAILNDASCTYPGCTNTLACNYTASAACDDGSCTFPGCIDQTACNYDPNAACDDASCTYPGCTNALACNYTASAACDDGSCTYPGCTDETACNYDPNAGCDSGTCASNPIPCNDECINADGSGTDFTSYYAPSNWSQDFGIGNGTILHETGSLCISGSYNGVGQNNTDATIVVNMAGTFTFTWNYLTEDENPSWDPAFYINGTPVSLSDDSGQNLQNGMASFTANAGDIIGFSINSTDSELGQGRLLITNFTYPTPNEICGCTAPSACNFDPAATVDDGNCTYPGCTDQTACNYDPNAGCDDSSCIYPGCTSALACNYNPSAACDDGSCTFPGCTDQTACNYDPNAGCDSGTCVTNLSTCSDECLNADGYGSDFTSYYAPSNWSQDFGVGDGTILHQTGSLHISGSNNEVGPNNTEVAIVVNISGTFTFAWDYLTLDPDGPSLDPAYFINGSPIQLSDDSGQNLQSGIVSFIANAGDIIGFSINSADSYYGEGKLLITNFTYAPEICGCTTPTACNFDPTATVDDGNCTYPGCADAEACNYDLSAGCDDGSCTYPGCTDQTACNYDPNAACDDLSCNFPGCTTALACNYNPSAGCDDGSCEYTSCGGCMAITACNYNPLATIEDGSCEYSSCSGCTYLSAVNYNSNASLDDGSCTFDQGGPAVACSSDMNADGMVNAADLLIFLSAFGTSCE